MQKKVQLTEGRHSFSCVFVCEREKNDKVNKLPISTFS